MYYDFMKSNYAIDSISKEFYYSSTRKRNLDITRVNFTESQQPVYVDLVNTISAFKYVIDYKMNSELYLDQTHDEMVSEYTQEYITCTKDSLNSKHAKLIFVQDTFELKNALDDILKY